MMECDKKNYDRTQAYKALRAVTKKHHKNVRVYKCNFCGNYHLTHLKLNLIKKSIIIKKYEDEVGDE